MKRMYPGYIERERHEKCKWSIISNFWPVLHNRRWKVPYVRNCVIKNSTFIIKEDFWWSMLTAADQIKINWIHMIDCSNQKILADQSQ